MPFGLRDLAQQSAEPPLQLRQIGFDPADDHRFDLGAFDGFDRGRVEVRMVHAEDRLGAAVLELVLELFGGVKRVAGDADGPGLEDAEINRREMRQVGQEDAHAVALADAPRCQKMGDAVGRVLHLGIGPGGVAEDGVNPVGKFPGAFIQNREKRFVVAGDFPGNAFGPVRGGPVLHGHNDLLFFGTGSRTAVGESGPSIEKLLKSVKRESGRIRCLSPCIAPRRWRSPDR